MSKKNNALLASMNIRLQMLDLLLGVMDDIEVLKVGMNYSNKIMEEIRSENQSLKATVDDLQSTTETLLSDNTKMKVELFKMQKHE
ncbi:hypothetical protein D1N63_19735 [Clostridioides difficile]|nr:hypothetical protein D1N63_19735 [Clostridioides difficile]